MTKAEITDRLIVAYANLLPLAERNGNVGERADNALQNVQYALNQLLIPDETRDSGVREYRRVMELAEEKIDTNMTLV